MAELASSTLVTGSVNKRIWFKSKVLQACRHFKDRRMKAKRSRKWSEVHRRQIGTLNSGLLSLSATLISKLSILFLCGVQKSPEAPNLASFAVYMLSKSNVAIPDQRLSLLQTRVQHDARIFLLEPVITVLFPQPTSRSPHCNTYAMYGGAVDYTSSEEYVLQCLYSHPGSSCSHCLPRIYKPAAY